MYVSSRTQRRRALRVLGRRGRPSSARGHDARQREIRRPLREPRERVGLEGERLPPLGRRPRSSARTRRGCSRSESSRRVRPGVAGRFPPARRAPARDARRPPPRSAAGVGAAGAWAPGRVTAALPRAALRGSSPSTRTTRRRRRTRRRGEGGQSVIGEAAGQSKFERGVSWWSSTRRRLPPAPAVAARCARYGSFEPVVSSSVQLLGRIAQNLPAAPGHGVRGVERALVDDDRLRLRRQRRRRARGEHRERRCRENPRDRTAASCRGRLA